MTEFKVCILAALLTGCSVFMKDTEFSPRIPRKGLPEAAVQIHRTLTTPSAATIELNGPVLPNQIPLSAPIRSTVETRLEEVAEEFTETLAAVGSPVSGCSSVLNAQSKVTGPLKRLLNVQISYQQSICGTAHPLSWIETFVVQLDTHRSLSLDELFPATPEPVLPAISEVVRSLITQRYPTLEQEWVYEGTSPHPQNYSRFLIERGGLLVIFDKYQVGPYSGGVQELVIPWHAIDSLITEESPLHSLLVMESDDLSQTSAQSVVDPLLPQEQQGNSLRTGQLRP